MATEPPKLNETQLVSDFMDKIRSSEQERLSPVATPEELSFRQKQQESPEFKKWFEGSKVVDSEGKPLVVYHGTTKAGFDSFNTHEWAGGAHFGDAAQANDLIKSKAEYRDTARKRNKNWDKNIDEEGGVTVGNKDAVYPVYLSIKNPMQVMDQGNVGGWTKMIKIAKERGHDGLKYRNQSEGISYTDRLHGKDNWAYVALIIQHI